MAAMCVGGELVLDACNIAARILQCHPKSSTIARPDRTRPSAKQQLLHRYLEAKCVLSIAFRVHLGFGLYEEEAYEW